MARPRNVKIVGQDLIFDRTNYFEKLSGPPVSGGSLYTEEGDQEDHYYKLYNGLPSGNPDLNLKKMGTSLFDENEGSHYEVESFRNTKTRPPPLPPSARAFKTFIDTSIDPHLLHYRTDGTVVIRDQPIPQTDICAILKSAVTQKALLLGEGEVLQIILKLATPFLKSKLYPSKRRRRWTEKTSEPLVQAPGVDHLYNESRVTPPGEIRDAVPTNDTRDQNEREFSVGVCDHVQMPVTEPKDTVPASSIRLSHQNSLPTKQLVHKKKLGYHRPRSNSYGSNVQKNKTLTSSSGRRWYHLV